MVLSVEIKIYIKWVESINMILDNSLWKNTEITEQVRMTQPPACSPKKVSVVPSLVRKGTWIIVLALNNYDIWYSKIEENNFK